MTEFHNGLKFGFGVMATVIGAVFPLVVCFVALFCGALIMQQVLRRMR